MASFEELNFFRVQEDFFLGLLFLFEKSLVEEYLVCDKFPLLKDLESELDMSGEVPQLVDDGAPQIRLLLSLTFFDILDYPGDSDEPFIILNLLASLREPGKFLVFLVVA